MASTTTKSERTRQRILDAAAAVLAEEGYAAASLSVIATRAGLQAPSLYYHFGSKDELVGEVLSIGVQRSRAAVEAAVAALGEGCDAVEALREAVRAHLVTVLEQGPYTSANIRTFGQLPDELRRRHLAEQRRYGAVWRALFERAAATGRVRAGLDLRVVRLLVLGAMNWSIEWFDPDGDVDPDGIAHHLTTVVFDGLIVEPNRRL
jgi:AcrR family transcriptional regulator